MISIGHYLALACTLFFLGMGGVILSKNIITFLVSILLMLNASILVLISNFDRLNQLEGQLMMLAIIAIAICKAALGLSLAVYLSRRYGTIKIDFFKILRG